MDEEELRRRGFVPALTIWINDKRDYRLIAPEGSYPGVVMLRVLLDREMKLIGGPNDN